MATRKKKPDPIKESNLLAALQFISVAQHSEGTIMQTHCRISNGTVIGFDGGMTAGDFVDEVLSVCPHTKTLITALSKCKESISITQLETGRLSVKSGKFRALVPCVPFDALPAVAPDDPCAAITDAVKSALAACVPLTIDSDPDAFKCGVLLQAESAVATNRHVLIEAWHGLDLPPNLLIPRASVMAIIKSPKSLSKFGFSHNSATFYFEDNSFIKTQLFTDQFPNYRKILDIPSSPVALPEGFYDALENISPFAEKIVYFRNGKMHSHSDDAEGASCDVIGLTDGLAFQIEYLKLIRQHAHNMHFNANERGLALFFGENVRGGVMKYGH